MSEDYYYIDQIGFDLPNFFMETHIGIASSNKKTPFFFKSVKFNNKIFVA